MTMPRKDYYGKIDDLVLRKAIPFDKTITALIKPNRPDGAFIGKCGTPVFVEYENSSRGLVAHVPKYLMSLEHNKIRAIVVFLRSPNHVARYKTDYERSSFVAKSYSKIVSFEFIDCQTSSIDEVLEILARWQ